MPEQEQNVNPQFHCIAIDSKLVADNPNKLRPIMSERIRYKTSPFRLAVHEFRKTFRKSPPGVSDYDFFKILTDRRTEREKQFARLLGWSILLFLVMSISGVDLSINIKTTLIEMSIPKVYLVFLASMTIALSILELVSASLLQSFQNVAASRFAGRFPPVSVLAIPQNSGSVWGLVFNTRFDAFRPARRFYFGVGFAGLFLLLPLGLVYLALYVSQFVHIIAFYSRPNTAFMGYWVNAISVLCMIAPIVLVAFTVTKLDLRKNQLFIRWSFLKRIYAKYGFSSDPNHWFNRP